MTQAAANSSRYDVIVIGAGFAGMYSLHRLRQLGLRVRVLEAGNGVGGTWYWNRYPGARCDIESLEYSYSFSEDLQQEWEWPERYATQPEILKYANHVADRFDLRRDIQFNTRVTSAVYFRSSNAWKVTTNTNEVLEAQFCIMASGNLSLPRVPDFKGLDTFKGKWYHTGQWPHQKVDFTGMRVGIIGTGASGIQSIPIIAKEAKHLHVFQRSANYSVPAINRVLTPAEVKAHKEKYPAWRKEALKTPFGIAGFPPPTKLALEDTPEARLASFEKKWGTGGNISFLYAYKDLLTSKEANETVCEFVRDKIRTIVKDPAVAADLIPNDHYIGTKRLPLDTDYYETFNRENVTLVNIKKNPIVQITANGIQTSEQEYAFDAIVFATGFDAMTGALLDIDIRVDGEADLRSKWVDGPKTYLGIMTAGFPNMMIITGPGSPSVKTNMIAAIEQHVDWITDLLKHVKSQGLNRIEADRDAEEKWVQHVNEVGDSTLYPLANSWYVGANIPGKPRVFMPYVAGLDKYRVICDQIASEGYRGLQFER